MGILFARKLSDPDVMLPVAMLFVAFCMSASCVYLLNDVADREEDARHPVKRHRPIAAGELSVGAAIAAAVALAAGAIALVWFLPTGTRITQLELRPGPVVLAAYLALNVLYSTMLKRVAIADVTCVALGFLIRVASGPGVVGLEVSSWLILCTFFGALFLALAKRRGELLVTGEGGGGRSVLQHYSSQALDVLVGMAGTATLICYSTYTVWPETVAKFHTQHLIYTVPFVFFGLGRYLLLVFRRQRGEDPAAVLFTDKGMIVAIVGWLLASWLVITLWTK